MLMRIMANPNGNYLRARGEYVAHLAAKSGIAELPPRTRRILWCFRFACVVCGTTSAHAENTCLILVLCLHDGNYLRARGEYTNLNKQRRRRDGTTSAHAENTDWGVCPGCGGWNYLRARGEYRKET